jgi:DMSO/TMAO reductase YedYZ heme-binding membrane subunit
MRKAWNDIKSFVTVTFTLGYLALTFMGKMTPEYQDLYKLIVIFYFGTQAEKLANKLTKENDNNGNEM